MIEVILPVRADGGLNKREHWTKRAKRAKAERFAAHMMLRSRGAPILPCVVRITRLSAGEMDDDNLRGAAKACRDGIADWLGVDDRDPRVTWNYAQQRCKRGEYGVRVEVKSP